MYNLNKEKFLSILIVGSFFFQLVSCEEKAEYNQQNYPIIQTNEVTEIDSSGAKFSGELLKSGIDEILDYGFVWNKNPKPNLNNFKISLGNEITPKISKKITFDLIANQNYYVRVYVVTINQIIYSNEELFTSLGSSKPIINSFTPKNGIDGDTLTIEGKNFGSVLSSNVVKIGSIPVSILTATSEKLKILIPSIPQSGSYKIQVTSNGKSGIAAENLTIENPFISTFTPNKGPDGTTLTIKGDYFSYNKSFNKVYLNQMPCQVIESSRTQLKAITPFTLFVGTTKVIVNINGKINTPNNDYFIEGPYITDVNPLQGSYKDVVTISGEGFSSIANENIVSFGPLKVTILSTSNTKLSVVVPDLPGDPVAVSIRRANKLHSFSNNFIINNPWNKISSDVFPGQERGMATGFSVGTRGFITLGRVNDYNLYQSFNNMEIYKDLWEYNSSTNSWIQRPNFPGESRYYATGFSIGSKGYVGSGISNNQSLLSDFYEYDSEANSWKKISNMPGTGRYGAVSFSAGGKGYVGLGKIGNVGSNTEKSDFFEYDPITNIWKQFSGPSKPSAFDFAFSLNNKGYVVIDGKELWELNPSTYTWIRRSDYPDNLPFGSFSFTIGNKAYAGSGLYGAGITLSYSRNFYEYDPNIDQWNQLEGFDYLKRFTGVAWGLGNKGYVLTGQSNAQVLGDWPYKYLKDFWVYNKP